ncbi:MAG: flagella basal body P-ring formation protein FlgA, partial [Phycisphaerae bacterium]
MAHARRQLWSMLASLALATLSHAQDVVRLRGSAVVPASGVVTLADVATIEGTQTDALRAVVLRENAAAGQTISLDDVRSAMRAAKSVNSGRIALSGASVSLVAPVVATPTAPTSENKAADAAPGTRVRDAMPAYFAREYAALPEDVRLTFSDGDAATLDISLSNRTFTLETQGASERVQVHVRVYEGDKLITASTVRVGVLLRRDVLVASRDLNRGTPLDEQTTTREQRWLPVTTRVGSATELQGRVAKSAIRESSVIELRQAEEAIVIRKGELVAVDCISGGVVLR